MRKIRPWSKELIVFGLIIVGMVLLIQVPTLIDFQPTSYASQSADDWIFDPNDEAQVSAVRSYTTVYSQTAHFPLYERPIWEYTAEETGKLPINKRVSSKIIADVTEVGPELYATVKKIISDQRQADEDIDEMIILVYPEGGDVDTPSWIIRALWLPLGDFGNVDWHIATENDRSNYKITYQTR